MTLEKQELVNKNNRVCSSCGQGTYRHKIKGYEYWRASKITGELLCQKCYHKEYRQLNPTKDLEYRSKNIDKIRKHATQYYKENKKRIAKRTAEYNKLHPEIKRRYRELNKEHINEYQRKYYKKHRIKILRQGRASNERNRDKRLQRAAIYRQLHREEINKKARERRLKNRKGRKRRRKNIKNKK